MLRWWEGNQLALAVDATTLGQRFVVLVISVLYRGCAIPVAWTVFPATEKHGWRGEWLRMLRQVQAVVLTAASRFRADPPMFLKPPAMYTFVPTTPMDLM